MGTEIFGHVDEWIVSVIKIMYADGESAMFSSQSIAIYKLIRRFVYGV